MKLYGYFYAGWNKRWVLCGDLAEDRKIADLECELGKAKHPALKHAVIEVELPAEVETPEQTEARLGAF